MARCVHTFVYKECAKFPMNRYYLLTVERMKTTLSPTITLTPPIRHPSKFPKPSLYITLLQYYTSLIHTHLHINYHYTYIQMTSHITLYYILYYILMQLHYHTLTTHIRSITHLTLHLTTYTVLTNW